MNRRKSARKSRRKRSLGPLLRLALPVVATALTLGALLVNTMSGGSAASWSLTGVSAVMCAGAWGLYRAASRPRRRSSRRRGSSPAASPGHADGPEVSGAQPR